MTYQEIEETLRQSCNEVVSWGWSIQPSTFLNADSLECCPLGAMLVSSYGSTEAIQNAYPIVKSALNDQLCLMLGINDIWRHEFWAGFDDMLPKNFKYPQAYQLGKIFRAEFVETSQEKKK